MASPREGRRSNRTRLIAAASALLVTFDARADDAGPFLALAFLFVVGGAGIVASFIVRLTCSDKPARARILPGLGVAAANLVSCFLMGNLAIWVVSGVIKTDITNAFVALLGFLPWILPVALWVRWRLRPI